MTRNETASFPTKLCRQCTPQRDRLREGEQPHPTLSQHESTNPPLLSLSGTQLRILSLFSLPASIEFRTTYTTSGTPASLPSTQNSPPYNRTSLIDYNQSTRSCAKLKQTPSSSLYLYTIAELLLHRLTQIGALPNRIELQCSTCAASAVQSRKHGIRSTPRPLAVLLML